MKEIGKMMCEKVRVLKNTQTTIATQGNFHREKLMEWVFINGLTARHMMVSGLTDIKKGMGFGKAFMVIHMSVSG